MSIVSRAAVLSIVVVTQGLSFACEASPTSAPASAPTPAVKATVPAGPVGQVLSTYEAMRQALAADTLAPLSTQLTTLQAAVAVMQKDMASERTSALTAATTALSTALSAPEPKLADVRVAYGELSRAVVAIIATDASLMQGRYLFECPMAKGYKRWVQVKPEMENPYMGQRMLECGSSIASWGSP